MMVRGRLLRVDSEWADDAGGISRVRYQRGERRKVDATQERNGASAVSSDGPRNPEAASSRWDAADAGANVFARVASRQKRQSPYQTKHA